MEFVVLLIEFAALLMELTIFLMEFIVLVDDGGFLDEDLLLDWGDLSVFDVLLFEFWLSGVVLEFLLLIFQ